MNKTMKLAVAAALAMGASAAQAGITIPAGDWTVDIGGNVNAFYQNTNYSGRTSATPTSNTINTGLLPSAVGIGAKTRQNDLDIGVQFTFFTGIDSTNNAVNNPGAHGYGSNAALGMNSLNIRQAFLTFGDKSWGTIKMGRDLGVFESDAILSDMTLLGVGTPAGGGNTTLGRIGYGYLYADWKTQIQYASPNWNGFSFVGAVDTPWKSSSANDAYTQQDMGFEGKAQYEWAGDVSGKVWVGGIYQKVNFTAGTGTTGSSDAKGWDIGGKVAFAGAELVGSYYDGEGIGNAGFLLGGFDANNQTRSSKGGYVQGTYKIPNVGTKIGLSWGESKLDANAVDAWNGLTTASSNAMATKHESWIVGAYHPLTKSLNLVAEYTDSKDKYNDTVGDAKAKTVSLGAILFF